MAAASSRAERGAEGRRTGRVSAIRRPCGLAGVACAVPPCADAISAAMASPRPEPGQEAGRGWAAGESWLAGEALAGEALAGEALAGEALAGEALAGEALAGWAPARKKRSKMCGSSSGGTPGPSSLTSMVTRPPAADAVIMPAVSA